MAGMRGLKGRVKGLKTEEVEKLWKSMRSDFFSLFWPVLII